MSSDLLAADRWTDNGRVIEAFASLGFLTADMVTLDATHGQGVFGKWWRPDVLVRMVHATTKDPAPHDLVGDFTSMPFADRSFDAVWFDPPYMPKGTPHLLRDMDARYGVGNQSAEHTQALMADGFAECDRIARDVIVTKTGRGQDAARLWVGDDLLKLVAYRHGWHPAAEALVITTPRSQAHRGPQKSLRSNYSTMTVWLRASPRQTIAINRALTLKGPACAE